MTRTVKRPRGATPDRADFLGRDVLDARTTLLEQAVARQDGVSKADMDAERPGGTNNRDTSATGALAYLCWLHRQHAQGPTQQVTNAGVGRWDARGMDDLRAALAAEPIYLTLESGRQVGVYPKSFHALTRLLFSQQALAWATQHRVDLAGLDTSAASLAALQVVVRLEARLTAEFVAIITHAGPGVPWDDADGWEPPLPAWIEQEATPLDCIMLQRAHVDVNLLRINAIAERTRQYAGGGSESMPLAAFLGVMAADAGTRPEEIARRYSLGEVFASALSKFEAYERAKAKADADKPPTGGR